MKKRIFYFDGHYATLDNSGNFEATNEEALLEYLRAHPYDTTVIFFRESNEPEPTFFRQNSTKVRNVPLNHGDVDPIRPLLQRELKDCSAQVFAWLKSCGATAPALIPYFR